MILGNIGSIVQSLDVDPNARQKRRKKVVDNHNPKQLVNWTSRVDPVFVTISDVRKLLIQSRGLDGSLLESAVTKVWTGTDINMSCFELHLSWVYGKRTTKAEAMVNFMRAGDCWATAKSRFDGFERVFPVEKRLPPKACTKETIERELTESLYT